MTTLQSFIGGRWIGTDAAQALKSAIDGHVVAHTHADQLDFAEAVSYARRSGVPALMAMDFQTRAQCLKALAKYLMERKEQLYAISHHSGATRMDSWIDIEGGAGTLFAYASLGSRELPSGNLIHEGPAIPLGKQNHFAGTHILVPRSGLAVHINAFNFPIWGMLEKFAPTFLAGMPCIIKPATATSYVTEAAVRLLHESGLLPEGSLQLIVGSTGDLLDRLDGQDVVTFTGSADTAAKLRVTPDLIRRLGAVHRRGRLAELRHPRSRRDPGRRRVRPVRQGSRPRDDRQGRPEVHRDPSHHRPAEPPRRRRRAPVRASGQGSGRRPEQGRREDGRPRLARPVRGRRLTRRRPAAEQRAGLRRPATASPRSATTPPKARSSPRPCCAAATRTPRAAPTTSRPSARSAP